MLSEFASWGMQEACSPSSSEVGQVRKHLSRSERRALFTGSQHEHLRQYEIVLQKLETTFPTFTTDKCGSVVRSFFEGRMQLDKSIFSIEVGVNENVTALFENVLTAPCDPGRGGNVPAKRYPRKRQQIFSMLELCLEILHNDKPIVNSVDKVNHPRNKIHIVEFCSGSGHIGFPLLSLLEREMSDRADSHHGLDAIVLTLLDMNGVALQRAKKRAEDLGFFETGNGENFRIRHFQNLPSHVKPPVCFEKRLPGEGASNTRKPVALRVEILECMVADYETYFLGETDSFDIGTALHACGKASDEVLDVCTRRASKGFVVCPCCVGRLGLGHDNAVFMEQRPVCTETQEQSDYPKSDGQELAEAMFSPAGNCRSKTREEFLTKWATTAWAKTTQMVYPRSSAFRELLSFTDYQALAKAADWHEQGGESVRDAGRLRAKSFVELDRMLCAEEQRRAPGAKAAGSPDLPFVTLRKMQFPTSTPKNDVLVGKF
ncbi:hypothetical protein CYMTET_10492 [Cymbomonas tetramitiformis]|uniref:Methyltransferase domain-containing protein n=1 Tax=Cymbomonas tetramitiformis TaxID=36881 RepID=A0AAE0GPM8_9CHLO|nr:hypothetical protein CYMTET_10492 [Cymbomonas tetramitiformis]|eukprot:gene6857-8190_t